MPTDNLVAAGDLGGGRPDLCPTLTGLVRPATAPPIGSAWDVPQALPLLEHHQREWVAGSAVAPELAAANLQSLAGAEVLEALAGDRLAQLGAHAQQYATQAVARLLRPLEPVAAGGGWWCSGLDPLADWAPMAWGCFKPDQPRWDAARDRPRKYEHPIGAPARLFWLRVPAAVAEAVAIRHDQGLPPEVLADADGSRGAFWRWWAATRALPLVITEGAKKAAALLSAGIPAVAAPGIWNPSKRNAQHRPELLPELAAVPLERRQVLVVFDASDKPDPAEPKAARRLGRLLQKAGALVRVGVVPGSHGKGADDHLANGGSWEQLAAALAPISPAPVLPRLRQPDQIAPAGQWLGVACPIPSPQLAPLVAMACPMGAGKTEAIAAAVAPLLATGQPVVLLTHRRALGEALANRLGLAWGDDAKPGSDHRRQGLALCVDSLCRDSGMRFSAADWAGAVVILDEAAQVLAHALMGTGTAIANRRPAVLSELAQLLAGAAQVIAADAQLSEPVLQALEQLTSRRALLIGSHHQPAAGRQLISHHRDGWRLALLQHIQARRRCWIATTAQQACSSNSAQNLAALVREHWPAARVLVVDSETIATEGHPAAQLAADPNRVAAAYDVVICTPAVAAGLSVDQLPGYFEAVFCWAGGTTSPEAVAQAAARVRDQCPRHLYAPETSPGGSLRIGSGSGEPASLLRHLHEHEAAAVGQLLAAGGWEPTSNSGGPWLPLWAELASTQNRQRHAFRATVLGLLQREGYRLTTAEALAAEQISAARQVREQLQTIATKTQAAEDLAIQQAEPLTDQEAAKLEAKQRRRPEERAQLQRWRIARAWALDTAAPISAEQITAHRDGAHRRHRFRWLLLHPEHRGLVDRADLSTARKLSHNGQAWAPDLVAGTEGPTLAAAAVLGLPAWLDRADWFRADDPQLLALHALATTHAASMVQVLGVSPGERATTTLRQLLALAGYRLEAKRRRCGEGKGAAARWHYRVVAEPLPAAVEAAALEAHWLAELGGWPGGGVYQKIPSNKGGNGAHHQPEVQP